MTRRTINRANGSEAEFRPTGQEHIRLSILSSFKCGQLEAVTRFWAHKLEIPLDVIVDENYSGPDRSSSATAVLQNNHLNVILLRLEDWVQEEEDPNIPTDEILLDRIDELQRNIQDRIKEDPSPYLILITPGDPSGRVSSGNEQVVLEWMKDWASQKEKVMVEGPQFIEQYYPLRSVLNKESSGDVSPYRPEYFTALGSMILRVLTAIYRKPYKMVVLDCDHTLWKGSCSNGGHKGVMLSRPYRYLQEFMISRKSQGLQLAICSKNAPADVMDVFEHYPDMPLKSTDIIIDRVNWESKCKNIREITRELGIEKDRVIFIDDNPVECAEVQSNCPGVLTCRLPDKEDDIPEFLDHLWAFDHFDLSGNAELSDNWGIAPTADLGNAKAHSASLAEFIVNLDTDVRIMKPRIKDLLRMSQLTIRAVRFNFSGVRREVHQIQGVLNSGHMQARICMVSDRIDEYGISGMMLFGISEDRLILDTFIMDWRVMGRGVEHEMLSELGRIAEAGGLKRVEIYFKATPQNQPAREFLESVAGEYREPDESGYIYRIPAGFLSRIRYSESRVEGCVAPGRDDLQTGTAFNGHAQHLSHIARHLYNVKLIHEMVEDLREDLGEQTHSEPGEKIMELISEVEVIWKKTLGLEEIGADEDFFEMGGTSLQGYQIIIEVQKTFGLDLDTTVMNDFSSIRKLSRKLYHELNTGKKGSGSFEENGGAHSGPDESREVIII